MVSADDSVSVSKQSSEAASQQAFEAAMHSEEMLAQTQGGRRQRTTGKSHTRSRMALFGRWLGTQLRQQLLSLVGTSIEHGRWSDLAQAHRLPSPKAAVARFDIDEVDLKRMTMRLWLRTITMPSVAAHAAAASGDYHQSDTRPPDRTTAGHVYEHHISNKVTFLPDHRTGRMGRLASDQSFASAADAERSDGNLPSQRTSSTAHPPEVERSQKMSTFDVFCHTDTFD